MKYIILLCDGMSDEPIFELGGKTPMEVAYKPNMDALAKNSFVGMCRTVPVGMKPGSDVANLSVLGYDPKTCYSGRSPLEAANIGIELADGQTALRLNFVTLSEDEPYEQKTMLDYCAGDITTEESAELIAALNEVLADDIISMHTGVSYRNCMVVNGGELNLELTPPHDISGKCINGHLPKQKFYYDLMKKSYDILKDHPVNKARREKGKHPANSIWLWGEGARPKLEPFSLKYGINGGVVSAVDLINGIGKCAKMQVAEVEGATGYIDTNFIGKANAVIEQLNTGCDFSYLHIEAPDECGHRGELDLKIKSIEIIDEIVLPILLDRLSELGDFRLLIMNDHPTPIKKLTHTADPVPFILYDSRKVADGVSSFNEKTAAATGVFVEGVDMMKLLLELRAKC